MVPVSPLEVSPKLKSLSSPLTITASPEPLPNWASWPISGYNYNVQPLNSKKISILGKLDRAKS
jgi:hypothetical protein